MLYIELVLMMLIQLLSKYSMNLVTHIQVISQNRLSLTRVIVSGASSSQNE